jgi:hypothetical protein
MKGQPPKRQERDRNNNDPPATPALVGRAKRNRRERGRGEREPEGMRHQGDEQQDASDDVSSQVAPLQGDQHPEPGRQCDLARHSGRYDHHLRRRPEKEQQNRRRKSRQWTDASARQLEEEGVAC